MIKCSLGLAINILIRYNSGIIWYRVPSGRFPFWREFPCLHVEPGQPLGVRDRVDDGDIVLLQEEVKFATHGIEVSRLNLIDLPVHADVRHIENRVVHKQEVEHIDDIA